MSYLASNDRPIKTFTRTVRKGRVRILNRDYFPARLRPDLEGQRIQLSIYRGNTDLDGVAMCQGCSHVGCLHAEFWSVTSHKLFPKGGANGS